MSFTLDGPSFTRDLRKLAVVMKQSAHDALRQQSRLFVADACALTPPTGDNPLGAAGARRNATSLPGNSKAAQRQGQQVVGREIRRLFVALSDLEVFRSEGKFGKSLRTLSQRGNWPEVLKLLERAGFSFTEVAPRATAEILNRHRDRKGRVIRRRSVLVRDGRSIERLVRQQQALVGRAKAGWVTPARALGLKLPAWITKHNEPGSFTQEGSGDKLSITVANTLGYAQKLDASANIMNRAWRNRARNLKQQVESALAATARAQNRRR